MRTTRAKVVDGGSQAIRLPNECRLAAQQDVRARRAERGASAKPVDEWSEEFLACLGSWSGDIPRLKQRSIGTQRNPFD